MVQYIAMWKSIWKFSRKFSRKCNEEIFFEIQWVGVCVSVKSAYEGFPFSRQAILFFSVFFFSKNQNINKINSPTKFRNKKKLSKCTKSDKFTHNSNNKKNRILPDWYWYTQPIAYSNGIRFLIDASPHDTSLFLETFRLWVKEEKKKKNTHTTKKTLNQMHLIQNHQIINSVVNRWDKKRNKFSK